MEIKILHLFYDLMNLYGEYANLNILVSRLEEQGITTIVEKKSIEDNIDFNNYDFIYCGSGTEKNELVALDYLNKIKDNFKSFIDSGKYALFTGNSMELFGNMLIDIDGTMKQFLNFSDFNIVRLKDRVTGDVIFKSDIFKNEVIGFINKQANLDNLNNNIFEVEFGIGADKENKKEGIRINNVFATYVIGPLLVKNPEILNFFVNGIIKNKDESFDIKLFQHENEEEGYNLVLKELKNRKNE